MTATADTIAVDAAPYRLSPSGPTRPTGQGVEAPVSSDPPPSSGTRKRLDHIDAMRPVKQAGVVGTHTLLAFAPVAATVAAGASLMLLHVTREAFLFVSACMLTYSYRQSKRIDRSYWQRRFMSVGVPYLCWTVIYFLFLLPTTYQNLSTSMGHLGYLFATGYYQLYYLIVVAEFYVLFPLLLLLVRRTTGRHGTLLAVSGAIQILMVGMMHWNVLPPNMRGFWASREITSYQFYLIAGMVVAFHLDEVHAWLCRHVRLIIVFTLASAAVAEAWYYLSADNVVGWLGSSSDPFQPVVIPFNIGAIAGIYLVGVALVDRRRSRRVRSVVQSGSDNAYGIYLAQMIVITLLGWLGWRHLDGVMPWPLVAIITVGVVFVACMGLTAVLARTPWSKVLTGRSRATWRSLWTSREGAVPGIVGSEAPEAGEGTRTPGESGDSPLEVHEDEGVRALEVGEDEGRRPLEVDLASR
ncbi:MAG TPA: acyltransferase [Acidimicrobiales bacterium]|nr:acyltransferase [Acidimicrobiales bacterium]